MDEAEHTDRIAVTDHGQIVATEAPDELKRAVGADTVEIATAGDSLAASRLAAAGFQLRPGGDRLVVFADDGEAKVPGLIRVFLTLAVSGFGKPNSSVGGTLASGALGCGKVRKG